MWTCRFSTVETVAWLLQYQYGHSRCWQARRCHQQALVFCLSVMYHLMNHLCIASIGDNILHASDSILLDWVLACSWQIEFTDRPVDQQGRLLPCSGSSLLSDKRTVYALSCHTRSPLQLDAAHSHLLYLKQPSIWSLFCSNA